MTVRRLNGSSLSRPKAIATRRGTKSFPVAGCSRHGSRFTPAALACAGGAGLTPDPRGGHSCSAQGLGEQSERSRPRDAVTVCPLSHRGWSPPGQLGGAAGVRFGRGPESAVGTRVRRVFPSHVGEGGCGHAGPASPRGPGPFRSTVLSVSPRCAQAEDTEGEGRGLHPLSLSQGAARCHGRHAPAASPGPGCGGGIRQRGLGSVHRAVNAGGNGAFVAEEAGVEWPLAVPRTSLDEQRKCPLSVPFSS